MSILLSYFGIVAISFFNQQIDSLAE